MDPTAFAVLQSEVKAMQKEQEDIKRTQAEIQHDVKELLALANKGRGALWIAMSIPAVLAGLAGFFAGKGGS